MAFDCDYSFGAPRTPFSVGQGVDAAHLYLFINKISVLSCYDELLKDPRLSSVKGIFLRTLFSVADDKNIELLNEFLKILPKNIISISVSFTLLVVSFEHKLVDKSFSLQLPEHFEKFSLEIQFFDAGASIDIYDSYFKNFFDNLPLSLKCFYFCFPVVYFPDLHNLPPSVKSIAFDFTNNRGDGKMYFDDELWNEKDIMRFVSVPSSVKEIYFCSRNLYESRAFVVKF